MSTLLPNTWVRLETASANYEQVYHRINKRPVNSDLAQMIPAILPWSPYSKKGYILSHAVLSHDSPHSGGQSNESDFDTTNELNERLEALRSLTKDAIRKTRK
jgi:hypothetical protein